MDENFSVGFSALLCGRLPLPRQVITQSRTRRTSKAAIVVPSKLCRAVCQCRVSRSPKALQGSLSMPGQSLSQCFAGQSVNAGAAAFSKLCRAVCQCRAGRTPKALQGSLLKFFALVNRHGYGKRDRYGQCSQRCQKYNGNSSIQPHSPGYIRRILSEY